MVSILLILTYFKILNIHKYAISSKKNIEKRYQQLQSFHFFETKIFCRLRSYLCCIVFVAILYLFENCNMMQVQANIKKK